MDSEHYNVEGGGLSYLFQILFSPSVHILCQRLLLIFFFASKLFTYHDVAERVCRMSPHLCGIDHKLDKENITFSARHKYNGKAMLIILMGLHQYIHSIHPKMYFFFIHIYYLTLVTDKFSEFVSESSAGCVDDIF